MAKAKKKKKHIPERMCTVCRKRYPQKELMRFTMDQNNEAHIDLRGKSGGRGLYLCREYACMEAVLHASGKRRPFNLHKDSRAILEGLHAKQKQVDYKKGNKESDVLQLLGLARRANKLSLGFDATGEAIEAKEAKLVLIAGDVKENTLKKLRKVLELNPVQSVSLLNKEKLSKALGKSTLAVCSVNDQGFSEAIMDILLGKNINSVEGIKESEVKNE